MIMQAGWHTDRIRVHPQDKLKYLISESVIRDTERVLAEYGSRRPSCEGLVYWAGIRKDNQVIVTTCIAPATDASRYNIGIDHVSNFHVVNALYANKLVHLGQVHSHPGTWIDHSDTDDEYAAFKIEGLLSLVVPNFCEEGMMPLTECGVHRFNNGEFHRLSDQYTKEHFEIITSTVEHFIDLRNE
jgi:Prokaryotic homologs of the JAB domain